MPTVTVPGPSETSAERAKEGGENSAPQSSTAMASTRDGDGAEIGMAAPASPADSNTSSAMAIDLTTPPSTPPSEEVPLLVLVEEDIDDPNSVAGDELDAERDHSLQLSHSSAAVEGEELSGGTTQTEGKENCSIDLDDESMQAPLLGCSNSKHSAGDPISTSQNGDNDDLFLLSSNANNMSMPNRSQGIQTSPSKQPQISHTAQVAPNEQQLGSPGNSITSIQARTPPASPSTEELRRETPQSLSDGILSDEELGENTASYRVRQVAKVKQFFTTLQSFSNRMSSEVAEQVQELITALVNGTATIEEFHQEIQMVTNHPLKEFIIPFLRENLDLFRNEIKESSHALSDILGEPPTSNTIGLTPQLADTELPVLPSSKHTTVPSMSTAAINSATQTTSSAVKAATTSATVSSVPFGPLTIDLDLPDNDPAPFTIDGGGSTLPLSSNGSRKRQGGPSAERSAEKETQISNPDKSYLHSTKRPRYTTSTIGEHSAVSVETPVITSGAQRYNNPLPPPPYPHPHPPPHTASHILPTYGTHVPVEQTRRALVADDWNHIDVMLSSIMGMVERTREAVTMLKSRVLPEIERREFGLEQQVQQRISEAVEKVRHQCAEEKKQILMEGSRQLQETVATVRSEMEGNIAKAQSTAVQEALKEANIQLNSKESCWNCGRRATETCSGCNKARYCGTFCQHKDWGSHMHQCTSGMQPQTRMEVYVDQQDNTPTIVKVEPPSIMTNQQPVSMAASDVTARTASIGNTAPDQPMLMGLGGASQRAPEHAIGSYSSETRAT